MSYIRPLQAFSFGFPASVSHLQGDVNRDCESEHSEAASSSVCDRPDRRTDSEEREKAQRKARDMLCFSGAEPPRRFYTEFHIIAHPYGLSVTVSNFLSSSPCLKYKTLRVML